MLNRLSGLAVAAFGLGIWLYLVPHHTESVDYGWMRPQTLPMICAVALIVLGAIQTLRPTGAVTFVPGRAARAAVVFAVAVAAVWAMGRFGFVVVGPLFAAALMLGVGERRPVWLVAGVAVVPAGIWFIVAETLNRTLP